MGLELKTVFKKQEQEQELNQEEKSTLLKKQFLVLKNPWKKTNIEDQSPIIQTERAQRAYKRSQKILQRNVHFLKEFKKKLDEK